MDTAPRLRFPRHLRLVKRGDFQRAYKDGVRARGSILVVVAHGNELSHPRLGLSVGKVAWKSAVKRNRVRRVFREAFRLEQHRLTPGLELIRMPPQPKPTPELAATRSDVFELAQKALRKWTAKRAPRADSAP